MIPWWEPTPLTTDARRLRIEEVRVRQEVAYYSAKRVGVATYKRVSSILKATRGDPHVTLMFSDGTRHKAPVGAYVNVRA